MAGSRFANLSIQMRKILPPFKRLLCLEWRWPGPFIEIGFCRFDVKRLCRNNFLSTQTALVRIITQKWLSPLYTPKTYENKTQIKWRWKKIITLNTRILLISVESFILILIRIKRRRKKTQKKLSTAHSLLLLLADAVFFLCRAFHSSSIFHFGFLLLSANAVDGFHYAQWTSSESKYVQMIHDFGYMLFMIYKIWSVRHSCVLHKCRFFFCCQFVSFE